ncbi:MAG: AarF/UbiB family protein, partial [Pseudanabaena sp.]
MSQHPLEELNRYDAKANAEYYGSRPWLAISRILKIIYFAFSFGLAFGWDVLTGNTVSQPKLAEQLRRIITALGPTYIKVGQALSTRPDLVRVDFLEELTKLQDQLPPFSNDQAFTIIESELGKPVQTIYRTISEDPIAAASLGQVYKATLYSGEEVAVKVQRPE